MYRKIALTSVTLNVVLVLGFLGIVFPRICDLFKGVQVEMPPFMMWLITASHFVTNPMTALPTLAILLVGFFGVRAFGKRA